MLRWWLVLALAALTGCTSNSGARARAQAAYFQGRQQAAADAQQTQGVAPGGVQGLPMVYILGPVRYPSLPWTADLTLARAIVAAGYLNTTDPTQIVVNRNGEAIPVSPQSLLQGQDFPLLPGDRVEIRP